MSDLAARFAERAEAVGCHVLHATDLPAAAQVVREHVAGRSALVDRMDHVVLADVPDSPERWDAGVGISEAFAASAQSGTVALVHGGGAPRGTAALPDEHVVVVPADAVCGTYQEMVDRIAALDPVPAGVQFVTGPSRSGDIESAMVHGMHGPRTVTVVVVDRP